APVQAQAPAGQPIRAGDAEMTASRSTRNDMEPFQSAPLTADPSRRHSAGDPQPETHDELLRNSSWPAIA
ncbi:hypothetical protein, partial [Azohydromonas sediminis]|uniref:hypothetical protein n=1 Tax=Azohydromonas sediminis TaxID=2259674 RepID=UPI001B356CB8